MMLNKIISDDFVGIEITPILLDKELVFTVARPAPDAKPIFFMTATSPVNIFSRGGKRYLEHLRVDGTVDFLEYNGPAITDNFVNVGWESSNGRSYKRIDIFTGDSRNMET